MKKCVFTFSILFVISVCVCASSIGQDTVRDEIWNIMRVVNDELELQRAEYRLHSAEYVTDADGEEMGQTVFFNDVGNKRLPSHWLAGDPRRGGFLDIAYLMDGVDAAPGLPIAATTAAIDSAMSTWDQLQCSTIPITRLGVFPIDLGFVQFILSMGASGFPVPLLDITHGGWIPLPAPILGVTFTFVFIVDINNDGRPETAFREIYYSSNVPWGIGTGFPFDVETVALHEAGHGLSQGHFGKLFQGNQNGKFHFAPRAVMNAGYTGVQTTIGKTDNAGHCGIWASWP